MQTLLRVLAFCVLGFIPAAAQAVTTTSTYTITVTVTPAITSVNLSNTTVTTVGPNNANAVVGAISITTNPPGGTFSGPIVLGGTDAAKFALSAGCAPTFTAGSCNLLVGATNVAAGSYAITLSATQ